MKKSSIFSGVTAAILFTVGIAQASSENMANMKKCKVVKDGKGMIKEGKGACKTVNGSCVVVTNIDGDPEAWIMVPKDECNKINKGAT